MKIKESSKNMKAEIQQDIVNKYALLMKEIKLRQDAVLLMLNNTYTTPYPQTNIEFLALQFRKILELIALGSMVSNIEEYKKIRKSFSTDWNANAIVMQIEFQIM